MVSNEELVNVIRGRNLHEIIKNIDYITLEYLGESDVKLVLLKLIEVKENKSIKTLLRNNQMLRLSKFDLVDLFSCVCYVKDIELLEMLIRRGLDINDRILLNNSENGVRIYTTFLCKAVESNCVELVDLLIKNGANVNTPNKKGYIPLHKACISGNFDMVKLLVENGSYLNIRNEKGLTPLYYAYENRSIHTMLNDLELSYGPIEIYLKQCGAELGLNESNVYEMFRGAIHSRNIYILKEISEFKIAGETPDVGFISKLIVAYDEYERKETIVSLKQAIEELPQDRKLILYKKFFNTIGEEFKAEFDRKDTIYKEFIKGDPLFFNILNTSNQILNREDNVGNSTDKLDLLTLGFNNMVSKYSKQDGNESFAKDFIKSSKDSLVNIMHNIKDKKVIPNIANMLNEIRQDKQLFLLTNTRAGNIHNIPEAIFKIKTGPLKGKYALLLVNFGYGYNLSYLGAATVSMYVFNMDNERKVQEIANRIFQIANNFEDDGKSELKIKDFYSKIQEFFLEEHERILKPIYNIHVSDKETTSDDEMRIMKKNKNRQLGITLGFSNHIPRNICNCYVKQQQKILEVMFSILKTCHNNAKRNKSFDIVSLLRRSATDEGISIKYTHLEELMSVNPLRQEKTKDKGLETKKFKKELIQEILKVGVHGFYDKNKKNKRISKKEAVAIVNELVNSKKGNISVCDAPHF